MGCFGYFTIRLACCYSCVLFVILISKFIVFGVIVITCEVM